MSYTIENANKSLQVLSDKLRQEENKMEEFFNILDEIMKKIQVSKLQVNYTLSSIEVTFYGEYEIEINEILEKYNNYKISCDYDDFNKMTFLFYYRRKL